MNATEAIALRGSLLVNIRRRGVLIDCLRDDNMIMLAARTALARLIAGDGAGKTINRIGVGTNGTGPTPDDTALTSSFVKNLQGHSYPASGRVQFDWRLETTEANGKVIFPVSLTNGRALDFLGYRIWPTHRKIRKDSAGRMRRKMKRMSRLYHEGKMTWDQVHQVIMSWVGHAGHADTYRLRTRVLGDVAFIPPPLRGEKGAA